MSLTIIHTAAQWVLFIFLFWRFGFVVGVLGLEVFLWKLQLVALGELQK